MKAEQIEKLEALLAKATPGEWRRYCGEIADSIGMPLFGMNRSDERANAELVIAMREALPALLQLARAVRDSPRAEIDFSGDEVKLIAVGSWLDNAITGARVEALHGQTVALVPAPVKEG